MRIVLTCALFASALNLYAEDAPLIYDAWISEAPPGITVNAGYFIIRNDQPQAMILTAVSSTHYARVEMHRNVIVDGVTSMQAQNSINIAAQHTLEFRPGGYHLMLYKPNKPVKTGMQVELNFEFANGLQKKITADVRKLSNKHSDHSHH